MAKNEQDCGHSLPENALPSPFGTLEWVLVTVWSSRIGSAGDLEQFTFWAWGKGLPLIMLEWWPYVSETWVNVHLKSFQTLFMDFRPSFLAARCVKERTRMFVLDDRRVILTWLLNERVVLLMFPLSPMNFSHFLDHKSSLLAEFPSETHTFTNQPDLDKWLSLDWNCCLKNYQSFEASNVPSS